MDIYDAHNLPDDLPDRDRKAIEREARRSAEILNRLPADELIAYCEKRIAAGVDTIESIEARTESVPERMRIADAMGEISIPEDAERLHRRLFIALNWRNN